MAETKIGFFEESEGHKSSTRLFSFLTLIFTFAVIGYMVYGNIERGKEIDEMLILMLLTAAYAPKQIQKFAELKSNPTK